MASSFVEQATLKVLDEASKPIAKINRALKELFETAESLKSKPINITIGDKDVQSAIRNLRRLRKEINRFGGHGGTTQLHVNVNTAQAQRQIAQLHRQAQHPVTVATCAAPRTRSASLTRRPAVPAAGRARQALRRPVS